LLPLPLIMTFKTTKIALSKTGQFSKLMLDYIKSEDSLKKFYTYLPNIDSFKQAIVDKNKEKIDRNLLLEVLKKQYTQSNINLPDTIELLADEHTFTVCTGHQLCLFTGPLYFIYKVITTINLAESLKQKYSEYNFVPIYWMASEDHDFEEIKSINLFGKKASWENLNAKGAVGKLNTNSLSELINELATILGDSERSKELIQLFTDAYLKQNNLANATRFLVDYLFKQYGLVILDGDDAQLKQSFSAMLEDDILNNTNFKLVEQTITELNKMGVKQQVAPREINCFYLKDNLRERIVFESSKFKVQSLEVSFTKEQLLTELKKYPERFSPNVVTRPLYQQIILPNLAYVGGPGEIAYWLEYKAMFDYHKVSFPVLMPRNFALLTDEKLNQQIKKLGFEVSDIFKDTEDLIKEFVAKNADTDLTLKGQEEKITAIFNEIATKAIAVDVTLKGSVEAELQKTLNALKNMETKILRSEKQKQETNINQIKKLKEKFLPESILQERYENFSPYYLKVGQSFIQNLKEQFDPFDFEMIIMEVN
jgi:bacillithiol synthase